MFCPKIRNVIALLLVSAILPLSNAAADNSTGAKELPETKSYTFFTGYGVTHPGLGKTKQYVETLDLILRYEKPLSQHKGSSWYEGYHSLLVELPLHLVTDPVFSPMFGLNFLACWTFTGNANLLPYVFAGGGPIYSTASIPGMSTHWNGNWQFGLGTKWTGLNGRLLHLEYRYHHISNGGTRDPNDPLNSSKILFGISF